HNEDGTSAGGGLWRSFPAHMGPRGRGGYVRPTDSVGGQSAGAGSPVDVKAPNLLKGEYVPSFPLRLMYKDVSLAMDLAKELGVKLPAAAAAKETYGAVKAAAKEDLDYSAVMKFWKR